MSIAIFNPSATKKEKKKFSSSFYKRNYVKIAVKFSLIYIRKTYRQDASMAKSRPVKQIRLG